MKTQQEMMFHVEDISYEIKNASKETKKMRFSCDRLKPYEHDYYIKEFLENKRVKSWQFHAKSIEVFLD